MSEDKDCPYYGNCKWNHYAERVDDFCTKDSHWDYHFCPTYLENERKKHTRKEILKHRVFCVICGKQDRVDIVKATGNILAPWFYGGKINVNSCQTSKYMYKMKKDSLDIFDTERIPNACYDPSVKPRYVEYWECPDCSMKIEEGESTELKIPEAKTPIRVIGV